MTFFVSQDRAMISFNLAVSNVTVFSPCLLNFILIDNKEKRSLGETVTALGNIFRTCMMKYKFSLVPLS